MLHWLVLLFFFAALMGSPVIGFLVFALLGALHAWRSWRQPQSTGAFRWTRQDSLLTLCFISIPIFKALSSRWSDAPALALQNAFWHLYFIFWPLVLIGVDRCQSEIRKVLDALAVGLVVFGFYALFLELSGDSLNVPGVRPNVGVLAQLAMTAGIWNAISLTAPDITPRSRILKLMALAGTLLILIFSTRRLELLGFTGLLFTLLLFRLRNRLNFLRVVLICMLGLGVLALLIYFRQEKFATGISELTSYLCLRDEKPEVIYSSWGARLEMWRTGITAFLDHPLLGISASARPYTMTAWGGPGDMALFGHKHFHSHLVQTLVEGGLMGLTLLLVGLIQYIHTTMIVPFKHQSELALLSAGLLGAYAMEGLASAALQYDKANAYLVVASAWLWSLVKKHNQCQELLPVKGTTKVPQA